MTSSVSLRVLWSLSGLEWVQKGITPPCSILPFASGGIEVSMGLRSCSLVPGRVLIVG